MGASLFALAKSIYYITEPSCLNELQLFVLFCSSVFLLKIKSCISSDTCLFQ